MVPLRCVALSVVVAVVWTGRPNMKKKKNNNNKERRCMYENRVFVEFQINYRFCYCVVWSSRKKSWTLTENDCYRNVHDLLCVFGDDRGHGRLSFFCSLCFSFYLLHSLICLIREMFSHKTINEIDPQPTTSHRTRNKERKNIQKITGWSTAINEITQTWPTTTNYAMRWANAIEQEMG